MKIYYVENYNGFDDLEQFYMIDFEFGGIYEFDLDGKALGEFNSWDDFFMCWSTLGHDERTAADGKLKFDKVAVIERVL